MSVFYVLGIQVSSRMHAWSSFYRLLTDVAASREVAVGGAMTETGVLISPHGWGVTCGLLLLVGSGVLSWMFVSCLLSQTIIFSLF